MDIECLDFVVYEFLLIFKFVFSPFCIGHILWFGTVNFMIFFESFGNMRLNFFFQMFLQNVSKNKELKNLKKMKILPEFSWSRYVRSIVDKSLIIWFDFLFENLLIHCSRAIYEKVKFWRSYLVKIMPLKPAKFSSSWRFRWKLNSSRPSTRCIKSQMTFTVIQILSFWSLWKVKNYNVFLLYFNFAILIFAIWHCNFSFLVLKIL